MVNHMKNFDDKAGQVRDTAKGYDQSKDKIGKAISSKQEQDMKHRIKTSDTN